MKRLFLIPLIILILSAIFTSYAHADVYSEIEQTRAQAELARQKALLRIYTPEPELTEAQMKINSEKSVCYDLNRRISSGELQGPPSFEQFSKCEDLGIEMPKPADRVVELNLSEEETKRLTEMLEAQGIKPIGEE